MNEPEVFYNWQNPFLRDTIYPFRKKKLIEFLLTYAEVDIWKRIKVMNENDPGVKARLDDLTQQQRAKSEEIAKSIEVAIAERIKTDKWLGIIEKSAADSKLDPKSLRFRRVYYLDKQIANLKDDINEAKTDTPGSPCCRRR